MSEADAAHAPGGAARAARAVGELVRDEQVAVAESLTAGLVAQALAAVPGSMEWFAGGVVAYTREAKQRVLGVEGNRLVTRRTAAQMAAGVAQLFDARIAIATTGAAGPDPLDGAQPGTVVVGCFLDGTTHTVLHHLEGGPDSVCSDAAITALRDLEHLLRWHRIAGAPTLA